ncbi:hypothetical protein MKZ38_003728 [Zalerion maritima]|uniref:Uncharacterized protein n=1 Tax=Zalerion maritima TaxID=339359 RepID=A0AAD5S4L5_9PEZI|nr:hypothetical protein MKZ38_003728 [Zalerion maritima]
MFTKTIISFLAAASAASAFTVTLFTEPKFKGNKYKVEIGDWECLSGKDIDYDTNPHFWSAVGPKDAVCTYYADYGCTGINTGLVSGDVTIFDRQFDPDGVYSVTCGVMA